MLQTVPGIIVDRVNVGGAESGQQSNYQAKGASADENTWNMDGIAITDMGSLGSSPTYYDFDMFQEMQVTTGGADPANATPGVQLNFVLRERHQQVARHRPATTSRTTACSPTTCRRTSSARLPATTGSASTRTRASRAAGRSCRKLFAWGAYGKTEPEITRLQLRRRRSTTTTQIARDATFLENISAKVTGELSTKTRANFTYFRGNKQKFGRGASGSGPTRRPTTRTARPTCTRAR